MQNDCLILATRVEDALHGSTVGVVIAAVSLVLVFVTYRVLATMLQVEDVFTRWTRQEGYRVIHRECPSFAGRRGPFGSNRYRMVYRLTVEDSLHQRRSGWLSLGWWYLVRFQEQIEVCWDD